LENYKKNLFVDVFEADLVENFSGIVEQGGHQPGQLCQLQLLLTLEAFLGLLRMQNRTFTAGANLESVNKDILPNMPNLVMI
jgi:hypothetical protein